MSAPVACVVWYDAELGLLSQMFEDIELATDLATSIDGWSVLVEGGFEGFQCGVGGSGSFLPGMLSKSANVANGRRGRVSRSGGRS